MAAPVTFLHTTASAIEARLRVAFPDPLFDFALMADSPSVKELERVVRRKPFIGLGLAALKPGDFARQFKGIAQWTIFLMVENQSSAGARYTGDDLGIGLFGMLHVASTLLHGWTIDGVGAVAVKEVSMIRAEGWGDDNTAMAALGLDVAFAADPAPAALADLGSFLSLNIAWTLPDAGTQPPATTITLAGA